MTCDIFNLNKCIYYKLLLYPEQSLSCVCYMSMLRLLLWMIIYLVIKRLKKNSINFSQTENYALKTPQGSHGIASCP